MTSVAYLLGLLFSIAGLLLLDRRYRLFYWNDARAALVVSIVGVGALLLTDVAGIALGLFFRGHGEFLTGVLLAPELPLEEPLFLWLLILCAMLAYSGAWRALTARAAAKAS